MEELRNLERKLKESDSIPYRLTVSSRFLDLPDYKKIISSNLSDDKILL